MMRSRLLAALPAMIAAGVALTAAAGERPTVVELFTSQSCYSCPPAEALLGELAGRDDVIALEFHVDYWDDLVYGAAGRWKDVFSDPAFTLRQRTYAAALGSGRVYTPQIVLDGLSEVVGNRRGEVLAALRQASLKPRADLHLAVAATADGGLALTLEGGEARRAGIWLLRFKRRHVTEVLAGENKGKTLANHHVVTAIERVGSWQGRPARLTLAAPELASGEGCAILVQDDLQGPVLAAARCPDPAS